MKFNVDERVWLEPSVDTCPQAPSSRSRPRRATSGSRSTFCHGPAHLRVEPTALKFIKEIFDAKKVVAAVCHAPWLLIETGIAKGRRMTSFKSIKTDVANAGAKWEDSEVVVDQGVITSRNPGDLEAFSAKIIEEVKEGRHTQRSAA